jgi:hypothetical protein
MAPLLNGLGICGTESPDALESGAAAKAFVNHQFTHSLRILAARFFAVSYHI